ncbi:MAG: ATP-grasp domain-containing protein [Bacteriovoracaceae bacterium]
MKIGFPVLIKASAGGGGKGMRIVNQESEFEAELNGAKREAKNAFGDDTVLLEKYFTNPRHIEVQVMSDQFDNHFHFFERECSIQRRHQKIVEEAPAFNLPPEIKSRMFAEAIKICKKIKYRGAGTLEFIYDNELNDFYFLEMNTRLQVEHPITELTTGFDLVKLQIMVAEGLDLSKVLNQKDITQKGHAIEVRLYAEDPDNEFLPTIGEIRHIGTPSLNGVRLDCGFVVGNVIGLNYDPMLAKLITYGTTRTDAISKLKISLNEVVFAGVKNNRDYLQRILGLDEYVQGKITTQFVNRYKEKLAKKKLSETDIANLVGGFLFLSMQKNQSEKAGSESRVVDPWNNLGNFRNN